MATSATINATLIVYDVPVGVPASPPDFLRRFGFSINLSCWIVPTSRVPQVKAYFDKLPQSIRWETVHFDVAEKDKINHLAKAALQKEAQSIRESMRKTVAKAATKLEEIKATFQEETKADEAKKHREAIKGRIKHAMKLLEKAEEAALGFAIMADVDEAYKATAEAIKSYYQSWILEPEKALAVVAPDAQGPFAGQDDEEGEDRLDEITSDDLVDAMGFLPAESAPKKVVWETEPV